MSEANLPNWGKSNISDHFKLLIGGTPSRDNENYWDIAKQTENRWVSIKDLKGRYLSETAERISELGIQKSNVKLIPENTVIMSFKLTIGRLSITKRPLYTNEAIVSFIPKRSNSVDTNYLYYGLQSWNLLEEVDQAVKGATLNKDKMSRIVGLFPPLPEQKKIASILRSVDEVIENTQKQIDKLQDLKKATMNELLTKGIGHTEFKDSKLGRIPKSWQSQIIKDFCRLTTGGTPSTSNSNYWNERTIPWLSSGEVHKKRVRFADNFISEEGLKNCSAKLIPKKALLVALAGQGKTRGTVAITEIETATNQSIAGIITDNQICEPDYLFFNLDSRYDELRSISGGAGRAGLNLEILSNLDVALPPLPEQKKIASIFSSIDENIEQKQKKLLQTQSLKKALMQDLLTGEVRVQVN